MGKKNKTKTSNKGKYKDITVRQVKNMTRDEVEELPNYLKGLARYIRRDYGIEPVDYWKDKEWKLRMQIKKGIKKALKIDEELKGEKPLYYELDGTPVYPKTPK